MMARLVRTRYGQPARTALAEAISEAKAGDPLSRVLLVVPDHAMGLNIRRRLAADAGGLIAVEIVTLLDLARNLSTGSSQLAGRHPISDAVVLAATRRLLDDQPGPFGSASDHPSLERSILAAHRNLREVDPEALDRLSAIGGLITDVVDIHKSLTNRLQPTFHDERERADLAATLLTEDQVKVPPVILHLLGNLVASERRLVTALAATTTVTAIVGDADSPEKCVAADPHLNSLAEALGIPIPEPGSAGLRAQCLVASTPEQDEAIRYAIRRIVEAARSGTPLERIALVHPPSADDARLVQERLDAAGVRFHASGVRRVDESISGRFVVRVLDLPNQDLRRTDLEALMADVPLQDPNKTRVPARAWSRLASKAGVVRGVGDWTSCLTRLTAELDSDAKAEANNENRVWRVQRLEDEATMARQLAAFVEQLDKSLKELAETNSWSGRCRHVRELIRRYIGDQPDHDQWPAKELLALEEVEASLDTLAELDDIEPDPSDKSFRGALTAELRRPLGRAGRTGLGVQVVSIDRAAGLDADLVVVVGLSEGSIPTRPSVDPLLPDDHRVLAETGLPSRNEHAARQRHAFLAALTAASEKIVLIQPRGDLRRSGDRPMSRLLLSEFEALAGHRPEPEELHRFTAPWFDHIASFTDALNRDEPGTPQEYDLSAAIRGGPKAIEKLRADDPILDRGIEMQEARASSKLTRFDGNLSGLELFILEKELSATRLETWVDCPFAFFSEYVLGVRPLDEPEDRTNLAPVVRGAIVHRVLDRLVTEGVRDGTLPGHGEAWTSIDRSRAKALMTEECDLAEARGEAAHARFWPTIRSRLCGELDDFLVADSAFRLGFGSRPVAAEQRFDDPSPLIITLADGRNLRFRGSIDRVDLTDDEKLVVLDTKTGRPDRYKKVPDEYFPGGSFLQLPIYALAAAAKGQTTQHAAYAFFGGATDDARHLGYEFNDQVDALFRQVLTSIIRGVEGGSFPHHPPDSDRPETRRCPHCSPDGLDARRVRASRARKANDPVLSLHADHLETDHYNSDQSAKERGDCQ